jgi:enterobactin synthetase component D
MPRVSIDTEPPFAVTGLIWRETRLDRIGAGPLTQSLVQDAPPFGRWTIALPEPLVGARPRRRREWLAGRLCALSATAALGAPSVLPARDGPPVWPVGISGSITHRGNRVIAVASRDHLLGVDCEKLLTPDAAARLAPVICRPAEIALRPATLTVTQAVTLLFSAKEALYKALSASTGATSPPWTQMVTVGWNDRSMVLKFAGRRWLLRWHLDGEDVITLSAAPRHDRRQEPDAAAARIG